MNLAKLISILLDIPVPLDCIGGMKSFTKPITLTATLRTICSFGRLRISSIVLNPGGSARAWEEPGVLIFEAVVVAVALGEGWR